MNKKNRSDTIIVILFSFVLFLKHIGGVFEVVNIGIPLVIIFVIGILKHISNKQILYINKYNVSVLIFVFILILGLLYTKAPTYGANKIFEFFIYLIIAFTVAQPVIDNIILFIKSNIILFIIYIMYYIYFFGDLQNILNMLNLEMRGRAGDGVFHVIAASRYIGFCLINLFSLFYLYKISIPYKHIISFVLFVTGFLMMLFFGTKGPIMSILLAPMIYVSVFKKLDTQKITLYSILLIIIVIYLVYPNLLLMLIPNEYRSFFEYRYFAIDNYQEDRFSHYILLFSDFKYQNIFHGAGTGNFGFLRFGIDSRYYPHNIFAEIFYENGLFGLSWFLYLLITPLRNIKRALKHKVIRKVPLHQIYIIIILLYYLMNAQVSGDIASNVFIFVFLIMLSVSNKKMNRQA